MLAYLVRFSIRFYGIVIALAMLILTYGSYRFATTGLDIFPEFAPKQIIIQTESPSYSAEQVEILVTVNHHHHHHHLPLEFVREILPIIKFARLS
jgi:Cu/Ag efflux pump CusA